MLVADYPRDMLDTRTDDELVNSISSKENEKLEYLGAIIYMMIVVGLLLKQKKGLLCLVLVLILELIILLNKQNRLLEKIEL